MAPIRDMSLNLRFGRLGGKYNMFTDLGFISQLPPNRPNLRFQIYVTDC